MCELKTGIKGQVEYFDFVPSALDDLYLDGLLSMATHSNAGLKAVHDIIIEWALSLTEDTGIPNWESIKRIAVNWKDNKADILDRHRTWLLNTNRLKE